MDKQATHPIPQGRVRIFCRHTERKRRIDQSSVTARLNHIESLEESIEKLKGDNDALLTRINTSVDLDYVYKVATEELGMVYANKDQVRLYNKTESEYVRQYEDIPER